MLTGSFPWCAADHRFWGPRGTIGRSAQIPAPSRHRMMVTQDPGGIAMPRTGRTTRAPPQLAYSGPDPGGFTVTSAPYGSSA